MAILKKSLPIKILLKPMIFRDKSRVSENAQVQKSTREFLHGLNFSQFCFSGKISGMVFLEESHAICFFKHEFKKNSEHTSVGIPEFNKYQFILQFVHKIL